MGAQASWQDAGQEKLAFVGSARLQDDPEVIARGFASRLGFVPGSARRKKGNSQEAFRTLRKKADQIGVVVNVSNVVLNTNRKLDADEFRGFVLSDEYAPLVFVNSAASRSGQIFTLAHELGHLLLGESVLDDGSKRSSKKRAEELWCNKFAAELLVPADDLSSKKRPSGLDREELENLAVFFNASIQVILLRLFQIKKINKNEFNLFWNIEKARDAKRKEAAARQKPSRGPGHYAIVRYRFGDIFSKALCQSAADGHTLTRDAMKLLGVKKLAAYLELEKRILRQQ